MWTTSLLVALVGLPFGAAFIFAGMLWFGDRRSETAVAKVTSATFTGASLAAVAAIVIVFARNAPLVVDLGAWFRVDHYQFRWVLVGDQLSLPFALFSAILVGVIGVFSRRYLHREPGYFRFYFLLVLFGGGVELVVLAGTLDLVFFGWEVVGLTSALLIAFFHERTKPVEHGLRAFVTYRFCDVGLLGAAVFMHHAVGSAQLVAGPDGHLWQGFAVPSSTTYVTLIGLLLLWATMGKSAQVPFGGWLPRAMEGPTPSSAIFYGAISIHLGPYLLLRAAPLIAASTVVSYAVIAVGALTAMHATFVGRVQTDIKSALAYASMTQVGLIVVEVGLGFRYLALAHIVGHATFRTLQILRSPSLLHDHHHLEQAVGTILPRTGAHLQRLFPASFQPWLYRHALERGYFDAWLRDGVAGRFVRFVRRVDALDARWTSWLVGEQKPGAAPEHSDVAPEPSDSVEELAS